MRRIVGPNASGALRAELRLGEFVVCDQFVDRTSGRADTFYEGPETTHVSAADPYCPELRQILVDTARELGITVAIEARDYTVPGLVDAIVRYYGKEETGKREGCPPR